MHNPKMSFSAISSLNVFWLERKCPGGCMMMEKHDGGKQTLRFDRFEADRFLLSLVEI